MKLLYLAGVVLMGFAAIAAGIPFNEKDLTAVDKLHLAAAGYSLLNPVIRDNALVIDTKPQDPGVTTKECSHNRDSVLTFAPGSSNEAQRCKSPLLCCDTGLDAEIGCFCKVDTADSSRAQDGNDGQATSDPINRGRSCFNDRTGIWRCIKGFCAPEKYCLGDGIMCQYTDAGPACVPGGSSD